MGGFLRTLYLNRTACDILQEIRECSKTSNFSNLPGLVSELQSACNKMEAKLNDVKDLDRVREEAKELQKEIKKLKSDHGIDNE